MSTCFLALGSNLVNPLQQVTQASSSIAGLPATEFIALSPWYRSQAIGPGKQADYINGACQIDTQLTPEDLLSQLQEIELQQGRTRAIRWGARILDIDILLIDHQIINTPSLQVPHPRMFERNFVLYPLHDIAPNLTLPDGRKLKDLTFACLKTGLEKVGEYS